MRPLALDACCKAGGVSMGLHRAGFDVVGLDLEPQPRYPFTFVQGDILRPPFDLRQFALIWASPPCPGYSRLRHLPWLKGKTWPLLIEPARDLLSASGALWCIENVEDAPLSGFTLCGQMFGLPLYRHRLFETNFFVMVPPHAQHREVIGSGRMVNDRRRGNKNVVTVAGGQFKKADGERAMGIDWMNKDELANAIPPCYAEFIGRAALRHLLADPDPAQHPPRHVAEAEPGAPVAAIDTATLPGTPAGSSLAGAAA